MASTEVDPTYVERVVALANEQRGEECKSKLDQMAHEVLASLYTIPGWCAAVQSARRNNQISRAGAAAFLDELAFSYAVTCGDAKLAEFARRDRERTRLKEREPVRSALLNPL